MFDTDERTAAFAFIETIHREPGAEIEARPGFRMTGQAEPRARRLVAPVVAPGRELSSLVSWDEIPFGLTYTDQKRE